MSSVLFPTRSPTLYFVTLAPTSVTIPAMVHSFSSDVILTKRGKSSNGKEIMKVMDLNVNNGDEITLLVNGAYEQVAIIKEFPFKRGF